MADLVSNEPDFDLDQPFMSLYSITNYRSHPTTGSDLMDMYICLADHIYTKIRLSLLLINLCYKTWSCLMSS